jgi:hypothetical protein
MQPVQVVDYGHPTRMLCGSDMFGGAYWLDLNTGYATPLLYDRLTQTANGQGYVWIIKRCNGILYAFQYDNSYTWPKYSKVWISLNGQDWGTYYHLNGYFNGQDMGYVNGVRYISGAAQGYVHVTMNRKMNFKLKEAALSKQSCALILPKFQNLLNTNNKSHFTVDATAWTDSGVNYTSGRETGGFFGDYSLKIATQDPNQTSYGCLSTALGQATLICNGRNYIGHAWVKGDVGDNYGYVTVQGSSGISVPSFFWTRNPDQWIDVITMPDKIVSSGAADVHGRISILLGSSGSQYSPQSSFSVSLGGAAIGTNPTNFVAGGTPRNSEQLVYVTAPGSQWTSFLTIFPDAAYLHLKDYYDPWRGYVIYDQNDYVCYKTGTTGQQREIYKSNINNNTSRPPLNWTEVTSPAELPRYHIKTWDVGFGNRLVLYLDCCPYVYTEGCKIKLAIYREGQLLETLQHSFPFVWERRSQINIAISVGENIKMYFHHTGSTSPEEVVSTSANVANALAAGYFKNSVITHRYGDDGCYESLTFYTPFPNDKEFNSAMNNDAGAITQEMNYVGQ